MAKMEYMSGTPVFTVGEAITKEIQARIHRTKRINKKWAKRYGKKHVPDYETAYQTANGLVMNDKTWERIKKAIGGNDGIK